jgi:hypothetical protein
MSGEYKVPDYLALTYKGKHRHAPRAAVSGDEDRYTKEAVMVYNRLPVCVRRRYTINDAAKLGLLSKCSKIFKPFKVQLKMPKSTAEMVFFADPYNTRWYQKMCYEIAKKMDVNYVKIDIMNPRYGAYLAASFVPTKRQARMRGVDANEPEYISLKEYGIKKLLEERPTSDRVKIRIHTDRRPRSEESIIDTAVTGSEQDNQDDELAQFSNNVESRIAQHLTDAIWPENKSQAEAWDNLKHVSSDHMFVMPHVASAFAESQQGDFDSTMKKIGVCYPGCMLGNLSWKMKNCLSGLRYKKGCVPSYCERRPVVLCRPCPKPKVVITASGCFKNRSCFEKYMHKMVAKCCLLQWLEQMRNRWYMYLRSKSDVYGCKNQKKKCCRNDMVADRDPAETSRRFHCPHRSIKKCKQHRCNVLFPRPCPPKRCAVHGAACDESMVYGSEAYKRTHPPDAERKPEYWWKDQYIGDRAFSGRGKPGYAVLLAAISDSSSDDSSECTSSSSDSDSSDGGTTTTTTTTTSSSSHSLYASHSKKYKLLVGDQVEDEQYGDNQANSSDTIGYLFNPMTDKVISRWSLIKGLARRHKLSRETIRKVSFILCCYDEAFFVKKSVKWKVKDGKKVLDGEEYGGLRKITEHIYCSTCDKAIWLLPDCTPNAYLNKVYEEIEEDPVSIIKDAVRCVLGKRDCKIECEKSKYLNMEGECGEIMRRLEKAEYYRYGKDVVKNHRRNEKSNENFLGTDNRDLMDYRPKADTHYQDKEHFCRGLGQRADTICMVDKRDKCPMDLMSYGTWDRMGKFRSVWTKRFLEPTGKGHMLRNAYKAGEEFLVIAPHDCVIGDQIDEKRTPDDQIDDYLLSHTMRMPDDLSVVNVATSLNGKHKYLLGKNLTVVGNHIVQDIPFQEQAAYQLHEKNILIVPVANTSYKLK